MPFEPRVTRTLPQTFDVVVSRRGVPIETQRIAVDDPAHAFFGVIEMRSAADAHELSDTYDVCPPSDDDELLELAVRDMIARNEPFAQHVWELFAEEVST